MTDRSSQYSSLDSRGEEFFNPPTFLAIVPIYRRTVYDGESRTDFSITQKLKRLNQNYTAFNLGANAIPFVNIGDKAFYQSSHWILESVEFHRASFMENEIRGNREKWAARKKRPRLRKRKARKRKGGINWANQSGGEDETGELKTHRDATGRALRSRPIHPSSCTYVRTYVRTFGCRRICPITLIA